MEEPEMHATHVTNAAQPQSQVAARARLRPVWLVSAGAGVAALAVTELFWAAARLSGVPIAAAGFDEAEAQPVTVGLIAVGIYGRNRWSSSAPGVA
jgi:hypothetical protein